MFSLVGHLSVSSQSRKGSCASKPLFSQAMGKQDCRFIRYLYCANVIHNFILDREMGADLIFLISSDINFT